MSTKKRGRPAKRPETVADWNKQPELIPTQREIANLLRKVQESRLRELERLSMNHAMARKQMVEMHNIPSNLLASDTERETHINSLAMAAEKGDPLAASRIRDVERGAKEFAKLLDKQAEARENIKEQFRKERNKVLIIADRQKQQLKKSIEDQHALRRASQNYVESIEDRLFRIEQQQPEVNKINTYIAKIEYTHAKIKELEQENFRLKRALAQKGILEVST